MSEDPRPINMNLCGEWNRAGIERWDVVDRSWSVFLRNTVELVEFLNAPIHDPAMLQMVMTGGPIESSSVWEELAQRLHNQLASVASLIDHTRRLTEYYKDDAPSLVAEFSSRNETIRQMEQAAFLRDLRNYLLHYGHAPLISTLTIPKAGSEANSRHAFRFSAEGLLRWAGWKAPARNYLAMFAVRDGPVIDSDVRIYGVAMQELYDWLFEQRSWVVALMPDRFRIGTQATEERLWGKE